MKRLATSLKYRLSKSKLIADALGWAIVGRVVLNPDVRRMGVSFADLSLAIVAQSKGAISPLTDTYSADACRAFLVLYRYNVSRRLPKGWRVDHLEGDAVIVSRPL